MGTHDNPRSRRELLGDVLTGGLSVGALASLAGCSHDSPGEDPKITGTADTTRIRRSIASLQKSDPHNIIPTFKRAVKKMKNLPSSDPRNYQNQVAIHGTTAGFTECEHGNWLFLPWHRLYLFYFEEICRDLTGNQHFALPFWNWSRNRQLPAIFGQHHGSVTLTPSGNNPLYDSTRRISPGGAAADVNIVGPARIEKLLREPNFLIFAGGWDDSLNKKATPEGSGYGTLEAPPHNYIHGFVGGNLSHYNSPMDPVFWTHHCMVDCLWWEWNARRGHSNTSDSDWQDGIEIGGSAPAFETASNLSRSQDFVDAGGNAVTGSEATSLATVLMPLLGYHYETVTKGETPQQTVADTDQLRRQLEEGAEVDLELVERFPVGEELEVRVDEPVSVSSQVTPEHEDLRPRLTGEEPGQLLLTAKGISPQPHSHFFTRVFVNRPEVTREVPLNDPHFAGGISLFEDREHSPDQGHLLDVTDTLRRLHETDELPADEPLSFQFLAVPFHREEYEGDGEHEVAREFTIGALDLDITQSIINGEVVEKQPGRR